MEEVPPGLGFDVWIWWEKKTFQEKAEGEGTCMKTKRPRSFQGQQLGQV